MQTDGELSMSEESSTVHVKKEPTEGSSSRQPSEVTKATSPASCPQDDTTVISDPEDSDRGKLPINVGYAPHQPTCTHPHIHVAFSGNDVAYNLGTG